MENRTNLVQNATTSLIQMSPTQENLVSKIFESNLFLIDTCGQSHSPSNELIICVINSFRQIISLILNEEATEGVIENNALVCLRFLESHHQLITTNLRNFFETLVDCLDPILPSMILIKLIHVIESTHRTNQELKTDVWINKTQSLLDSPYITEENELSCYKCDLLKKLALSLVYLNSTPNMSTKLRKHLITSLIKYIEGYLSDVTSFDLTFIEGAIPELIEAVHVLMCEPKVALHASRLHYFWKLIKLVANG